jgi:dephospho-CoA kinase
MHTHRLIGLTGNIGCGKSTVASLLTHYPRITILNCDQIAKDIMAKEEHQTHINEIVGANTSVAAVIFADQRKRRALEAYVHPLVCAAVEEKVAAVADHHMCIVESAIIFETNYEERFSRIVVATCSPEEQFRRLRTVRRMTDAQIEARVQQQIPSVEKERRADIVINTDCARETLETRVADLYHRLITGAHHDPS